MFQKLYIDNPNDNNLVDLKEFVNKSIESKTNHFNQNSKKIEDDEVIISTFIAPNKNPDAYNQKLTFSNKDIKLDSVSKRIRRDNPEQYIYMELNSREDELGKNHGFLIKINHKEFFSKLNQAIIDGKDTLNLLKETRIGSENKSKAHTKVTMFGRDNLDIQETYKKHEFNSGDITEAKKYKLDESKTYIGTEYGRVRTVIDIDIKKFYDLLNQALLDGVHLDLSEETKFKPSIQKTIVKGLKT